MTEPTPFATLLDGLPRYNGRYRDRNGCLVRLSDVLARFAAVPADLAEAGNANIVGLLEASRELAGYASYAEIVGGISVNRPQIRQWCDAVFEAVRTMPIDAESGERTAPDLPALLARIAAQEAQVNGLEAERNELREELLDLNKQSLKKQAKLQRDLAAERAKVAKLAEAVGYLITDMVLADKEDLQSVRNARAVIKEIGQ